MSLDKPDYEAFLPHHTNTKHRVMAITRFPAHTQIHALATLPDALSARRLADALNSTLLNRPNHIQRLEQALIGLPDSIQAAIRQLDIDPERADVGRPSLAAHIYTHPIDGIMLFRTTSCTPGSCPECEDCANDCRTCEICDPEYGCHHCSTPTLTPRTADALLAACHIRADEYFDLIDEESPVNHAGDGRAFSSLPAAMRHQDADFIRNMARAFDDLADDLEAGDEPRPRSLAEQIALDIAIDLATALHDDDVLEPDNDLPATDYDCDFTALLDYLLEDDDHIGYLERTTPRAPGTLDYLFEPFRDDIIRDPHRGYRH